MYFFVFFKQKTAYEMRISDWSSDVCSSDLCRRVLPGQGPARGRPGRRLRAAAAGAGQAGRGFRDPVQRRGPGRVVDRAGSGAPAVAADRASRRRIRADALGGEHRGAAGKAAGERTDRDPVRRSEEHTSEPPYLRRSSYAVFRLKKKQPTD